MLSRYVRLAAVVAASIPALVQAQGAPPPGDAIALAGANVVDVRSGGIRRNVTVVLRNGRIESVGAAAAPGVRTIELGGKYLVAGLIDAHTHLATLRAARLALESGVTTVRSAGVSHYVDVGLRELARKGAIPGPDVVAVGYHVRPRVAEDAALSDPRLWWILTNAIDTPDELRQMVRANLAHGVDAIKVLATERAGTPDTDPRKQVYSEAELRIVVEEAATKSLPVLAHAHGDEGAKAAVRAGVASIEHGTYLSDATLQLMKEKGTYFDPTYTTVIDVAEAGGDYDIPALRIRGQHMLPRLAETVRHAIRMGVKIVTGGDTGYGPESLTRISHEVAALVELGMTPLAALQSATIVGAQLLGLDKQTGAIEAGLEADLIVIEGNPLENVRVLQDPLLVISNGRIGLDRLNLH